MRSRPGTVTVNPDLPDPAAPWIRASRLAFARGPETIFGPIDLAVEGGRVLVVEGGNGSGKTTLLRVLAGLLEPSEGTLCWLGAPREPWRPAPGELALVAHQPGLKPDLSPAEQLAFAVGLSAGRGAMPIASALAAVGLEGYEHLPVRRLSAGQRKRVTLATLLVAPANVWLLDEPYANLDRDGHALVDRLIGLQVRRGGGIVMTSHGHFAPEALPCTRIAIAGCAG
jgi:heme exporter protein A